MGTVFSYAMASSIILAVLYLAYKLAISGSATLKLNRAILLSIYGLSAIVPFMAIISTDIWSTDNLALAESGILMTDGMTIAAGNAESSNLFNILLAVYLLGTAIVFLFSLSSLISLSRIVRKGEHRKSSDGYRIVLAYDVKYSPFSIGKTIVMSPKDYAESGGLILLHEESHIRLKHYVDLIIAQLFCTFQWFNPAAWLMRSELREVHEFQADASVKNTSGVDIREYQFLLIKKAGGMKFPHLANSLNHSNLKKRITMMLNKKNQTVASYLRPLVILPALAAAILVMDIPAVAAVLDEAGNAGVAIESLGAVPGSVETVTVSADKVSESVTKTDESVTDEPDVFPVFPGGESEMWRYMVENLEFPEGFSGRGRVVVRFTVTDKGKIKDVTVVRSVNKAADEEAMRVVKSMPDWEPGLKDGKPVNTSFVLPVVFMSE